MTQALVVLLSALAAGLVQAVTGFGSGIVMMLFFPAVYPVLGATALSAAISLSVSGSMSVCYRRKINKKLLLLPAVCYMLTSTLALAFAERVNADLLLKIFGAFLIVLAGYFLFFANKIHISATPLSAALCALIAGASGGLFGIGGPPMVLYYLAALDDKQAYLGTIQAFFIITGLYCLAVRIAMGYYTIFLLLPTLIGIAAMLLGAAVGKRIVDKLDTALMRKLVYAVLMLTGILNLVK